MKLYTFESKEYYLADDIYNEEPISFVGCSKTSRLIIKKKNLSENEYIYMKYIKSFNEWQKSDDKYKNAKLFITSEWTHNNLLKFKENKTQEDIDLESMIAPPILDLDNHEKFVDIEGKLLNIEIRGTREINNIYFKVKDVSEKFELSNISNTLQHPNSKFVKDIHYKIFDCNKIENFNTNTNKGNQKLLFLTFKGLTKLLYVSHSKNAEHFQDWANKILFSYKLGTIEDKEELASSLIGVNVKNVRQVFSLTNNETPGVYLILCGNANKILGNEYSETDLVCKFGCSKDINRRLIEHENKLNKEFNTQIEVLCYSIIDPKYIFEAESSIKDYFKANLIKYKKMDELIVININNLDQIKKIYKMIQTSYIGCYEELNNMINKLKETLELEKHNFVLEKERHNSELKDKEIELQKERYNNELEKERHKNELNEERYKTALKDKDIEILQYKIKFLELNIK